MQRRPDRSGIHDRSPANIDVYLKPAMTRENNSFELFGPLAAAIRDLLFLEWDPCHINHTTECDDVYDDYIPAIHRLAKERHSNDLDEDIEHIAAYLNFVVKNYIGEIPDKDLNRKISARILALAEEARQASPQFA